PEYAVDRMVRALGIRAVGVAALVAVVALASGCSNLRRDSESANAVPLPEDMPLCSDQFQEGRTIEEATFGQACRSESDELVVPRYVRLQCADQRTLVWNDFAWGYVGQPMTLFDPNAVVRIPTDPAVNCRVNAATDDLGTAGAAGGAGAAGTTGTTATTAPTGTHTTHA